MEISGFDYIRCGFYDSFNYFGNAPVSPERTVKHFELEFFPEGNFTVSVEGTVRRVEKNCIICAKPGQVRFSYLPMRCIFVKFDTDGEMAELLRGMPDYFRVTDPGKTRALFESIIHTRRLHPENEVLPVGRILVLISHLLAEADRPVTDDPGRVQLVEDAKNYIKQNCTRQVPLSEIAGAVHLSPSYFHGIFTKINGSSPHDYLLDCRIAEAKKLLWNTTYSLEEISQLCGFGCQPYFNRAFRRHTGQTPGSYRSGCLAESYPE